MSIEIWKDEPKFSIKTLVGSCVYPELSQKAVFLKFISLGSYT